MRFTVLLSVVAVVLVAVNGESEPVAKAPAAVDAVMPTVDKEGSGIVIPELRSAEGFRDWLLTLTAEERRQAFMDAEAGPMPEGVYTGFMLSDRPNYEDFEISIVNKAIMAFIFDRWIGKEFDGKGNLQNVLRSDAGFRPKDLAGTLELENGYIDEKKSWMALYGNETKYNFILDEFREIQPGFLFGITFIVPAKKGDPSFFECGLVRLEKKVPKGKTATEVILERLSEIEPVEGETFSEGEGTTASWEEEDSYETKKTTEGEPKVTAQDAATSMPAPEAEAPEAEALRAEAPEDEATAEALESLMD